MSTGDKVSGKLKQAAGDLLDDDSLHREGRREQRKGEAKDQLAKSREKVDRKSEEVADLERKTS